MKHSKPFPDRHQNFWQLASIQSAAQSIPGILIGGVFAQKHGTSVAITAICIGNLLLWLIGLGVISMAEKGRKNAIENVKGFLGKEGSFLMSMILMVAFLAWYMIEIQSSMRTIAPIIQIDGGWKLGILGSAFGILIALLAMGGIRLIKWVSVIALPFLLCFITYAFFTLNWVTVDIGWDFSLPAILTVVAIILPGTVNLPTFFRHSRSRADSYLALTLFTIFDIFFQIFSVFTGMTKSPEFLTKLTPSHEITAVLVFGIAFVLISMICLNLVNIYYSSAAFEEMIPKLAGPKGYLIIGLIGTASYAFLQHSPPMYYIENIANNFIANLGVILLVSYLISVLIKHRPRNNEKSVSFTCWAIGCAFSLIAQFFNPHEPTQALMAGLGGTILAFLCVLFLEETTWSINKISQ